MQAGQYDYDTPGKIANGNRLRLEQPNFESDASGSWWHKLCLASREETRIDPEGSRGGIHRLLKTPADPLAATHRSFRGNRSLSSGV
jgi:hypothetical protein